MKKIVLLMASIVFLIAAKANADTLQVGGNSMLLLGSGLVGLAASRKKLKILS